MFAIAGLHDQYIKFPNTKDEINKAVVLFSKVARFPHVMGAIDGTHVKLQSPGNKKCVLQFHM